MHPYLFPWVLPSGAVSALAYLAALVVAALVASDRKSTRLNSSHTS